MEVGNMDETTKCEGCGSKCERTFEDVMGNPRCDVCLPGLDDDEFSDNPYYGSEY